MQNTLHCLLPVPAIFFLLADYSAIDLPYPLKVAVAITYMILTISWIMLMFFGSSLADSGIFGKIKIVFLMLLVLVFSYPLLILFSWGFSVLYFLFASLLSGFTLLYRARKSLLDFAFLILALIPILVLQPIFRPITWNELVTPLTFISSIAVFIGAVEAARNIIYPMMKDTLVPSDDSGSRSRLAITSTAMLVILFGLSIFGQDIFGPSPLSIISGVISDYAFIAGVVLGALALVYNPPNKSARVPKATATGKHPDSNLVECQICDTVISEIGTVPISVFCTVFPSFPVQFQCFADKR